MDHRYTILNARPQDLRWLPDIEIAAATLLIGHAPAAVLNETTGEHEFAHAQAEGRLWVAVIDDLPVGFVQVELLNDGTAHLKEIDVHPDHGQRGIGTQLVATACDWASASGYADITLTTFNDVPWNRPFYAHMGFDVVAANDLNAELRLIVADETHRGLDPARRVVMKRTLLKHESDVLPEKYSQITQTTQQDLPRLYGVWESSVRATHKFLSDAELRSLIPLAIAEIAAFTPIYCLRASDGQPFAMLGVTGTNIDMLFIHADYRGSGAGRLLADFAIHHLHANAVDVNEQNDLAVGFYRHLGFQQVGRSPTDSSGNPFPLLHMALPTEKKRNSKLTQE